MGKGRTPDGFKPTKLGLTEKQAAFLEAYLTCGSVTKASTIAGYGSAAAGYTVLRSSAVQRAVHEYRERVIQTEGGNEALRTIRDLMKVGNPPAVRLGAAKTMLGLAGHVEKKPEAAEGKSLADMSIEELAAQLRSIDEQIERGEFTVLADSAPESGAIPTAGLIAGPAQESSTPA